MKHIRLTFSAVAFAVLITFTGCQKDDVSPDMEEAELAIDEQSFQVTDVHALENPVVAEATEGAAFKAGTADTRPASHRLVYVLRRLDLNKKQRLAVRKFVEQHERCIAVHRINIQRFHEELVQQGNAVREEHINAFRAGEISKAELKQKLKVLHERLNEEIKNHQERQLHLRAMYRCRAELFSKIEAVLGPAQLEKWLQWKKAYILHP